MQVTHHLLSGVILQAGDTTPDSRLFQGSGRFGTKHQLQKFLGIARNLSKAPHNLVVGLSKTGWWLNQPIWRICSSKWESSPNKGVKIKHIWSHHLEKHGYNTHIITQSQLPYRIFWNLKGKWWSWWVAGFRDLQSTSFQIPWFLGSLKTVPNRNSRII